MRAVLVAGVVARLRGVLREVAVFDAPPVRGGVPYALVEEPVLADWSAKDWRGCEGRLAVILVDGGERPVRLRALLAAVENGVPGMPPDLGDGWRLVQLRVVRSRVVRSGERWTGTVEFMVRGWETGI